MEVSPRPRRHLHLGQRVDAGRELNATRDQQDVAVSQDGGGGTRVARVHVGQVGPVLARDRPTKFEMWPPATKRMPSARNECPLQKMS